MRRAADPLGELLHGVEVEAPGLGLAEHLDRGDLVAVLVEVAAPRLDHLAGAVGVDDAVGAGEHVDADLVDDPVVGGAQLEDAGAQVGVVGDRSGGEVDQLGDRGARVGGVSDGEGLAFGVDGVDEAADDVAQRLAGDGVELGALLGGQLQLELGEPGGEGGGISLAEGAAGGLLEQLLEGHGRVAVERWVDEGVLGDADGVDDDEAGLARRRQE